MNAVEQSWGRQARGYSAIPFSFASAFSARETNRVHLNDLGEPGAVAVGKVEYDRRRRQAAAG